MANIPSSTIESRVATKAPNHSTFISWRSIFVGLFISLLTLFSLISLGIGFGGIALSDLEGLDRFGWGAAIWMIISAMISLLAGSFVASRISNYVSTGVGMAQGATIAAVFFSLVLWGGGMFAGFLGNTVGGLARGVAAAPTDGLANVATQVYQNQEVQSFIRQQMAELGVPPEEFDRVLVGLVSRLIVGDNRGAQAFLAQETNINVQEASARLAAIQNRVVQTATTVAETTAKAFSAAGWYLFFLLVLGACSSIVGGVVGSKTNARHSLEEEEVLRAAFETP